MSEFVQVAGLAAPIVASILGVVILVAQARSLKERTGDTGDLVTIIKRRVFHQF